MVLQRIAAGAAAILLTACATTVAPPPTHIETGMPSPLQGPGQPSIERFQWRLVEKGWQALISGDPATARGLASEASCEQGRLLALQADFSDGADVSEQLRQLTAETPSYAAAWYVLSMAAESAGDELLALTAARRCAELWSRAPWNRRAPALEQRWIDDRAALAAQEIASGDAENALVELESAMHLAPERDDLQLTKARALIALERIDEADELLTSVGPSPAAIAMRAHIAESRTQWATAMDLYQSLPADTPDRELGLRRAQLRWRLSIQPLYVQEALASPALTRAELAVVLVATAPGLETAEGTRVPVLSDIVDLPSQREILTVVRTELLGVDPLERRFSPNREARADEVRDAVDALCHLLGYHQPLWCDPAGDAEEVSCIRLAQPISGERLAELVLGLAEGRSP